MSRILLVDDDPISLNFLSAALTQIGYTVVAVNNASSALMVTENDSFDLLLLDRRMPDMSGMALLRALRGAGVKASAIATSAEIDARVAADLREAGFVDAIEKPVSMAKLELVIRSHLQISADAKPDREKASRPVLDNQSALAAIGGSLEILASLRSLLKSELLELENQMLNGEFSERSDLLSERLHRLQASCGFCGAQTLATTAVALQKTLRPNGKVERDALTQFTNACRETIEALNI